MKSSFSTILSELRSERRLSQRAVSEKLGISQALLSHYENGMREPRLDFVVRVCEFYGVSTDYLLGRTDEKMLDGQVLLPCGSEDERRAADIGRLMLLVLGELEDEQLSRSAARYISSVLYTVLRVVRNSNGPYEPLYDAMLKLSEVSLVENARRRFACCGDPDIFSDEGLSTRYPKLYKSFSELTEIVKNTVCQLTQKG